MASCMIVSFTAISVSSSFERSRFEEDTGTTQAYTCELYHIYTYATVYRPYRRSHKRPSLRHGVRRMPCSLSNSLPPVPCKDEYRGQAFLEGRTYSYTMLQIFVAL